MISKFKWFMTAMSALILAVPSQAQSRWDSHLLGVAEYDTDGALFLLAGISASPGGRGISPIVGIQQTHLGYDNGPGRTNVFATMPYAGLSSNYGAGSVYGTLGYAFSNRAEGARIRTTASNDIGTGVVAAGGWDHWGAGSPWGHQVLASYNFDSEGFWGRGRLTRQISASGRSQRRVGGEVAFLGGDGYTAWQPGALIEFHNDRGGILGLGAGGKFAQGGENAAYFKVEGLLPIGR